MIPWPSKLLTAKRRMTRAAHAVRLSMLGWTQTQIAEHLGVNRQTVVNDLDATSADSGIFSSGLDPSDIANRVGWDLTALAARRARQRADLTEVREKVCAAMRLANSPAVLSDLLRALDHVDSGLRACAPDLERPALVDSI